MTVKNGEMTFYDDPELVTKTKATTLRVYRGEDDTYAGIRPGDRFTMKIKEGDSVVEKPGVVLAYWGGVSLRDIDPGILAGEGYQIDGSDAENELRMAALRDLQKNYPSEQITIDTPFHVIVCVPEDRIPNAEDHIQKDGETQFDWALDHGWEVFGHIPAYQILVGEFDA